MDKSIKQIADELNINKQIIYRYIKRNNLPEVHHEAHQKSNVKYYSDAVQMQIKQEFFKSEVHHEVHHNSHHDALIEMLKDQLIQKDKQIESLQKILDQEQQLHMCESKRRIELEQINDSVENTINSLKEENEILNDIIEYRKSRPWWKFWK